MAIKVANSVVGIEYVLTEAGQTEELDSNVGGQPLEFITGFGYIIPGLESGLEGMSEGDTKAVVVKAAEAYGEYDPEQIHKYPKDHFEGVEVKVISFNDDEVEIDANHPLAGKDLNFEVKVITERDATEDEVASGHIGGFCNTGG